MDASAATGEIGYTFDHAWKPRVSAFYGYASGDKDPNDGVDNRFERFFGFGRPWNANDYIVYENIRAPKIRVELTPTEKLRVDFGLNWYDLDSARDRFINGSINPLQDPTGASGRHLGKDFDIRFRHQYNKKVEGILGYAHHWSGDFILNRQGLVQPGGRFFSGGRDDTDFFYYELNISAF